MNAAGELGFRGMEPSSSLAARLMILNLDRFRDLLEDEADERAFEAGAIEAIDSESVQGLLGRVAAKHAS